MVALRSLNDESPGAELRRQVERAEWRREHERRLRNNHLCYVCGDQRHLCNCPPDREWYAGGSDDAGIEVGVE